MKAVLFDMDGVIIDSEYQWKNFEDEFFSGLCNNWDKEKRMKITGMSGSGIYETLKGDFRNHLTEEEFREKFNEMAVHIYREKVNLMPGFLDTVRKLAGDGVSVALVSSSYESWMRIVLDRFSLHDFFSAIVSAEHLDGKGKPAPDIYLLAAKKLGMDPRDCVVVEDSKNGALSAKSAGMFCMGYRNGFNDDQDLSVADRIISNLSDVGVVMT